MLLYSCGLNYKYMTRKKLEQMGFLAELQRNSDRLESIYDMAALCYDYIKQVIEDDEYFVGRYIGENSKAKNCNPNLTMLKEFSKNVERVLRKQINLAWSVARCLETIEKYIVTLEGKLRPYGVDEQNELTIPYFMLQAIDRYLCERRYTPQMHAPLNTGYCQDSYIYLASAHSMIEEAQEELNFSELIHGLQIRHQLSNLIILDRESLPKTVEAPRVVPLWIRAEDEERIKIVKGKTLKVAVIPFGEETMLEFPIKEGSLFYVSYNEKHKKSSAERAVCLLDRAIQEEANIIIFPEFVCSREVQNAIQNRLTNLYEADDKAIRTLLCVVAGSRWSEEDNNVAEIYSYSGRRLGSQYKYVRFCDCKDKTEEWLEALTTPGKECTIVDIMGVGKIQVGICRDVSEGTYTGILADVFQPFMLLVPAWSRSVNNGFAEQFRGVIARNHTTSAVLCNCCEALQSKGEFRQQVGIICTPYKDESVIRGKEKNIMREEGCNKQCDRKGCIFMAELVYDKDAVRNGEIVRKIQQKFVT